MSIQTSNASGRVAHRAVLQLRLLALLLIAPVVPLSAPAAHAAVQPGAGGAVRVSPGPDHRSFADRPVTMDEAVELAQRRYGARVVRAEVADRGGRRVYLLRLLSSDGRVFDVTVDASTGTIS